MFSNENILQKILIEKISNGTKISIIDTKGNSKKISSSEDLKSIKNEPEKFYSFIEINRFPIRG